MSASRPCRFTPGERVPGIHCIGGWVGPTAGLDDVEKRIFLTLQGLEFRPRGRPVRSLSIYLGIYRMKNCVPHCERTHTEDV
jgi:hypothetical protein